MLKDLFNLNDRVRALDSVTGLWIYAIIMAFNGDFSAQLRWECLPKRENVSDITIPLLLRRKDPSTWTVLPATCSAPANPIRGIGMMSSEGALGYKKEGRCKDEPVTYDPHSTRFETSSTRVTGYVLENDRFRHTMLVASSLVCEEATHTIVQYFQMRPESTRPLATTSGRKRRFSEVSSGADEVCEEVCSTPDSPPQRFAGPRHSQTQATTQAPCSTGPACQVTLRDFVLSPPSEQTAAPRAAPRRIRQATSADVMPFVTSTSLRVSIPCTPCKSGIVNEGMVVTSTRFPDVQFRVTELFFLSKAMVKAEDVTDPDYTVSMPAWAVSVVGGAAAIPSPPAAGPALAYWAFSSLRHSLITKHQRTTAKGTLVINVCQFHPELLQAFGMRAGPATYSLKSDEPGVKPTSALDIFLGDRWDLIHSTSGTRVVHHLKMIASPPDTYYRFIKALVRTVYADVVAEDGDDANYRQIVRENLILIQEDKHLHVTLDEDDDDDEF